jgi:hypothetical protein
VHGRGLAREGARVFVANRKKERGDALAADIAQGIGVEGQPEIYPAHTFVSA